MDYIVVETGAFGIINQEYIQEFVLSMFNVVFISCLLVWAHIEGELL